MGLDMICPNFVMFCFTTVISFTDVSGLPHPLNFLPFNQANAGLENVQIALFYI